jgi:hypothetical protein
LNQILSHSINKYLLKNKSKLSNSKQLNLEALGLVASPKGLGECSIVVAELWGAWVGLKFAWDQGYWRVELRLDAQEVVHSLTKKTRCA